MTSEKIIIITAPSGSGKTTLVKMLLAASPKLAFSVSACTRKPRPGEEHAKDYYFYTDTEFQQMIEDDAFVEWEMVYTGKYYGTLKSELNRIWNSDRYPLVDIDVNGALAIQKRHPRTCLSIFIEAPSLEILRERLMLRGTETPQTLEERIDKAKFELTFANQFDKIVVNDNIDKAIKELMKIVDNFIAD
jgi:guanylate kinase